ncbi:MAG TPA: hypothetical protein VE783_13415 [Candidatus Limnocylindrales bacterium]|nr:hypothetical protein [Candidatus Limnocylindrales bacterium]
MNCQQFQEVLPYIIENGGNEEEEAHLRGCRSCSELVRDLKYIAEQAKLLLPMHDPNPRVWGNIEQSLQREGLLKEGRSSRLGHITNYSTSQAQTKTSTPVGWILATAAALAFSALLVFYRPQLPSTPQSAQNSNVPSAQIQADDTDDQQLIAAVSQDSPEVRTAYENGLREVNAYITDAQQAVNSDPQDTAAQQQLLEAYQQKDMLYQMAAARSLP